MNDLYGSTVNAKGKKQIRSSAAFALVLGLALVLPGAAALASNKPIPGIDIVVKKNPNGIPITIPTGADGAYQLKGLAPGKYDLSIAGQFVQTISVDKGTISGVLSRKPDGKASITFNGQQVGVVPDLPGVSVISTSRSNKKAGIAKGEERDVRMGTLTAGRSNKKAGIAKAEVPPPVVGPSTRSVGGEANSAAGGDLIITGAGPSTRSVGGEANSALGAVSTTGGINVAAGDVNGDGVAGELPGKAGGPIKGGGPRPPPIIVPGTLALSEANDALVGASTTRGTAPRLDGGDGKSGISDQGAIGNLSSYSAAPDPKGGDDKLPGIAGEPIPGVDVNLSKEVGGGIVASSKTGEDGAFHFDKLPAGKYKLSLPGHLFPSIIALTVGADGSVIGLVERARDGGVIVTGDFEGSPAKVMRSGDGAIAIGTKSPAGAAPGKAIEIFDRWGTTGGISGGFGGGASIPGIGGAGVPGAGGMGGAGIPGAGVRP